MVDNCWWNRDIRNKDIHDLAAVVGDRNDVWEVGGHKSAVAAIQGVVVVAAVAARIDRRVEGEVVEEVQRRDSEN